ncbi:MAG: HAD-IA family hydrolase [Firmicutes bacterium]|nr:HAD-IA family hydrolase [Bacillota bacterium]
MKTIDTVLFDFDGTIMDTNNVILMSWQHTFRTLENREEDESKLTATFGEPLEYTLERFFPDVPVEESIEVYRSYQRKNFSDLIALFPGMKELVIECKARGYKTGLVTSRLKRTAMEGLEKFDLTKYFDVIVTPEDTDKHKPDPEPVNIALEKLGSQPENAVMLGDTLFDIQCSHNAGIGAVLVSWSLALAGKTYEDLGEDAPDHIIEKPEELFEII